MRALRDSSSNKDELKQYEFVLSDALDDLDSSAKDHMQLLAEQEDAAKHKKLLKPQPPSLANPRPVKDRLLPIFQKAYGQLRPLASTPEISVEFYSYTGISNTIRMRKAENSSCGSRINWKARRKRCWLRWPISCYQSCTACRWSGPQPALSPICLDSPR